MLFLRKIHTAYGFLVFGILFLIFFPWFLIPIFSPRFHKLTGILNRWWARLMFVLVFLPFKVEYRATLDSKKQYIFCPNHFSYLDIPTMGLNHINTVFVGKSAMEKIPLFGWMYSKLHITVDRSRLRSRFNSLVRSMQAVDEGKSLVIYPEGGMVTHEPPRMARFKDGAFRVAIEKQIPIVPVTIPYNWILLPDRLPIVLYAGLVKVIFHEPVETEGLTLGDIDSLKEKVYGVIDHELKKYKVTSKVIYTQAAG